MLSPFTNQVFLVMIICLPRTHTLLRTTFLFKRPTSLYSYIYIYKNFKSSFQISYINIYVCTHTYIFKLNPTN